MGMGIKVRVWGDYALFSRPEMKVERCSYDVITPSAARGILEAIYWHPGMKWCIDKIYVKKPIKFTSVRRNEVKSKISRNKMLEAYNGTWIEISVARLVCDCHVLSFPTRERGLKSIWAASAFMAGISRSPRGNVD